MSPNGVSLLHKGGFPQYGAAGAAIPSRTQVLRLSHNSPSWQHFTRDPLLCSHSVYTHRLKK